MTSTTLPYEQRVLRCHNTSKQTRVLLKVLLPPRPALYIVNYGSDHNRTSKLPIDEWSVKLILHSSSPLLLG